MAEMCDVTARVVSQRGTCELGHKVGDEFVIGQRTPEGLCAWAFCTLWPFATVLQSGSSFPWEGSGDTATVACPDAANPVVFELKRR
jgi:uncharacterized repeat protein (TIGR04076 family)